MIGRECKGSNVFSGPVLIGRGLDLKSQVHYAALRELAKNFLVGIAEGPHPFPSRTRPLSPPAPMVLGAKAPGRVGPHQENNLKRGGQTFNKGCPPCFRQRACRLTPFLIWRQTLLAKLVPGYCLGRQDPPPAASSQNLSRPLSAFASFFQVADDPAVELAVNLVAVAVD